MEWVKPRSYSQKLWWRDGEETRSSPVKNSVPQHEINLGSMCLFYVAINCKVLWPEPQEGLSHPDGLKPALPYTLRFSG